MTTKNIRYILLMSGLILGMASCKKYIDLTPKDATYDQVFWSSGANAEKALAGAYGLFRSSIMSDRSHFVFGDLPADEFLLDQGYYWNYQSLLPAGKFTYSYVPYLEGSLKDWTRFYAVINQCHLIVENTARIPESKFGSEGAVLKNQLIGEARFLRAYTYFYITRIWGDPVLTTESLKDPLSVAPLARSKETDVLNYCIADLKAAAELMDFKTGTANAKTRADKGSAWAVLAHIYAWQHNYGVAEKYCDSIINSNQYSLQSMSTFQDIWSGQSDESIFELNMLYDADNNEASSGFFGDFLHDPLIRNKEAYQSWRVNTDLAFALYDTATDMRFHKTIGLLETGSAALVKYANVKYYDANQPSVYVVNNNLVLLRLADIYLLKAEAAAKQGKDPVAQDALNVIKERAGLDPSSNTGTALFDEILEERYRELFGEGYLAYDLIRMGKLQEWFSDSFTPERIDKKGYYWPLDMRKLLPQDALLTQNEWWKNH